MVTFPLSRRGGSSPNPFTTKRDVAMWHRIARFPPQYGFWHSAAAEDFDSLAAEHRGLGQPGVDLSGSPQLCKKFFFSHQK